MKKRKRVVHRRHADDAEIETYEDDMTDQSEAKQPAPASLLPPGATAIVRSVGAGGTACLRFNVSANSAVNTFVLLASLPPEAAIIGGGTWVSEAFDGGGTFELGVDAEGDNAADPNTLASVDLATVGFTPLVIAAPVAPRSRQLNLIAKIDGGGDNTVGKAETIILYA